MLVCYDCTEELRSTMRRAGKYYFHLLCTLVVLVSLLVAQPGVPVEAEARRQSPGTLSVLISEIAWGGTAASPTHQWIELYNPGSEAIDLAGWRLATGDFDPFISLVGTIPAGGFFLLERGEDGILQDILADEVYPMIATLSEGGESLRLWAPGDVLVDTANQAGGSWPAGTAFPESHSMERMGLLPDGPGAWATNDGLVRNGSDLNGNPVYGTPKQFYAHWPATPTPASTGTATETATPTPSPTATATGSSTPSPSGTPTNTPSFTRTRTLTPTRTSTRTPTRSPTALPGVVVINEYLPHSTTDWNGDGRVDTGDEYVELLNMGTEPVNLNKWKLDNGSGTPAYILPGMILLPRQMALFYHRDSGLALSDGGSSVRLLKPDGRTADISNYPVVAAADQTWCRMPDGIGAWAFACRPTPGRPNALLGSVPPAPAATPETETTGTEIYSEPGSAQFWLEDGGKWGVFVE
jgi:hypothetical protein